MINLVAKQDQYLAWQIDLVHVYSYIMKTKLSIGIIIGNSNKCYFIFLSQHLYGKKLLFLIYGQLNVTLL